MARKSKFSRTFLEALDEELFRYKTIDRSITVRKLELEARSSSDLNSHIRSNHVSKRTEELAIKFDEDIKLKNLHAFRDSVDYLISQLNEEMQKIFKLRWLDHSQYTWEEIAEELYITKTTIYRRRTAILELYAEIKGYD